MENGLERCASNRDIDSITEGATAGGLLALIAVFALLGSVTTPVQAAAPATVAIAAAPDGSGYWLLHHDGRVETSGSARWYGDGGSAARAIGVRPGSDGYWIAHANGEVRAFGSAPALTDVDHLNLAAEIVSMATTPSGNGYWLLGGDGGVFSAGDARFHGSTGGLALARPVVGMAATPSGNGYWLVALDGGIFSFGDAPFLGSMGAVRLDADVIGMVAGVSDPGYLMIGADGGIFTFGAVSFHGSLGGQDRRDIVGVAPVANSRGYYMVTLGGFVFGFGAVESEPPAPQAIEARIELEIFARINAERTLRGIPALRWDFELAETAAAWSDTMAAAWFRHSNLDATLSALTTFHLAAGENIYRGTGPFATTQAAHQTLMDSAGHRNQILETGYTTLAIGVTCVNSLLYVTEQFGHPESDGPVQFSGARTRLPQAATDTMANTSC